MDTYNSYLRWVAGMTPVEVCGRAKLAKNGNLQIAADYEDTPSMRSWLIFIRGDAQDRGLKVDGISFPTYVEYEIQRPHRRWHRIGWCILMFIAVVVLVATFAAVMMIDRKAYFNHLEVLSLATYAAATTTVFAASKCRNTTAPQDGTKFMRIGMIVWTASVIVSPLLRGG